MYTSVTNEFIDIHSKTGRTFKAKIVLSSGYEIPNDNCEILSFKISRGNSSAEDITIGDVCSETVEAELSYHSSVMNALKDGMTTTLAIGLKLKDGSFEYVPMGEFKVLSFRKNGEKITLNLVDKLYDSDSRYVSGLIYPNTAHNVISEICNSLGISGYAADGINLAGMAINALPENVTKRKMLSYIASYFGRNVHMGRIGKLRFDWYNFDSPVTVTDDEIETPTLGDTVSITSFVCSVDKETVLTSGIGRALTFENPYMTQARIDKIRKSITYMPCEMNMLVGSALLDNYDVLQYGDSLIPVMGCELTFDGGVSLAVTAVGKTDEEAANQSVSPVDIAFEQAKKYAEDAIRNTTEIMNGVKGGFRIEKYDADGKPYATLWLDADTEIQSTHCIMINNSGIAFGTKSAGSTDWKLVYGWTIDGSFNTDFITANSIALKGSLRDSASTTVNGSTVGLHYEVAPNLQIPTANDNTFEASGMKAYSEIDGMESESYYTNWGLFFDTKNETSDSTALISSIMAALGGFNYFSNLGFSIVNSNGDFISGSPYSGFNASNGFRTTAGFFDNDIRCLTESTGILNGMSGGYLADCNSPTADKNNRVSIDAFNGNTANVPIPWRGSVGYLLTLRDDSERHIVQFCIRYRDNQIKMRVYNKLKPHGDGTNPAWSDWSEDFVTKDVTANIASDLSDLKSLMLDLFSQRDDYFNYEYDNATGQSCETSLSLCTSQWGKVQASTSGTQVKFKHRDYADASYSISLAVFGSGASGTHPTVWFSDQTASGFKVYSSAGTPVVEWTTIGR